MEFKKSSWHFRLLISFNTKPSTSLCVYFWQVVSHVLMYAAGIFALSLLASCVVAAIIWYGYGLFTLTLALPLDELWYAAFVKIGTIIIGVSAGMGIIALIDHQWEKFQDTRTESLLGSYLKAKKEKVCPVITFVDDKEPE